MTGTCAFRFLGVERELADRTDWNHRDWPKLWLYNAHYFDDVAADGALDRREWHRALIARWVAENPPATGNGWEPYPASLRIVNWIKWSLAGNVLDDVARHSLAVQVRHLRRRLEVHLLGNHLWANLKALLFAGAYFDGTEPARWTRDGLALFARELGEQILADGGHFERSPMYHAILLEDVLDLVQLADLYPGHFDGALVARWRETSVRMLRWLRIMSHPDGDISFFNDAAFGIAPNLVALERYAEHLRIAYDRAPLQAIETLEDSGYVRLEAGPAVLIADVGPVGPDYLPGHAHADTLSFELSLHGQRVLVNGGISTYEAGPLRLLQRSTSMHNTVEVDGRDSSEVWSSFRVARRARPRNTTWRKDGETLELQSAHDGYLRLPGRVLHSRSWRLDTSGLEITDTLTGRYDTATAYYRFAPNFSVETAVDDTIVGSHTLDIGWQASGASAALVPGSWYPRFGEEAPCLVLKADSGNGGATVRFGWIQMTS